MAERVLIVDDDSDMCRLVADSLRSRDVDSVWVSSGEEAFRTLVDEGCDAVITDLNMPGLNGIELCRRIATTRPDVPVIVMTAYGSIDTAIAAIRAGAYDFVTKPVELEMLDLTVARALKHRALTSRVRSLADEVGRARGFGKLLGQSRAMRELYDLLTRVAKSDASVLITGESGTGKELFARGLHHQGHRREGPFVAVNCSAFPDHLLESELFGHARGAFTDAKTARTGLFMEANHGSILLDEIGDLPLTLQPKLLRALEERSVRPVGSNTESQFDARIISSTNQDLQEAAAEGSFRSDLLYRVAVIHVEVPPLRARGTDVLLLAQHFLGMLAARTGRTVTGLTTDAAERLITYSWPGNVRELRNAMERAVALARLEKVTLEDLPSAIRDYEPASLNVGGSDPGELVSLEEVERRYVSHVLDTVGGNRTLAARVLGIDRKTLYRRLKDVSREGG